ncbi:hypothetical protein Salat_1743400 [Sesamum alatum]|uniref:Uncharacterized protein n=1 Tax=Sesamum alatum TaxID=300844 RepID=A0AAE2CKP6_9LAMI|nr:hypothetical protein Salat_1743400 [Sesamum alatum]
MDLTPAMMRMWPVKWWWMRMETFKSLNVNELGMISIFQNLQVWLSRVVQSGDDDSLEALASIMTRWGTCWVIEGVDLGLEKEGVPEIKGGAIKGGFAPPLLASSRIRERETMAKLPQARKAMWVSAPLDLWRMRDSSPTYIERQ